MKKFTLGDVCQKASSNIAQKDLLERTGKYPVFGASGFIKNIDFYHQKEEYIAIVKDGSGIGRTMLLPAYSSVIGTMQYLIPTKKYDVYFKSDHFNLIKQFIKNKSSEKSIFQLIFSILNMKQQFAIVLI